MTPLAERPAFYTPVLTGIVFAAVLALLELGALQPLELAFYDRLLAARGAAAKPDARVALVGATEEDIGRFGWPASDETLTQVLKTIDDQKPRAIGLDIYRDQPRPPGSERFTAFLKSVPNVISVMKIGGGDEPGVPPPPVLQGSDRVGFADVASDPGGVVRRGMLFLDDDKGSYFSFPLRLALLYLAAEGIAPAPGESDPSFLRLGKTTIAPFEANDGGYVRADAGGYQFMLDYAGGAAPFARYSFADVLDGRVAADAFAARMVVVGVTAPSVKDFFETPYGFDSSAPTVHGIALHGHVASQLVRMALDDARPLRVLPQWAELAWLVLWCFAGALAGAKLHGLSRFAGAAVAGAALLVVLSWAAFQRGLWLPLMPQTLGWLASLSLVTAFSLHLERAQRSQLMGIFSRYMGPDMAADVWQRRSEFLEAGGRPRPLRLTATVLFSDIKGFTAVSEKLDAAGLMEWLNSYMEAMAGLVMRHGGVVDKFIGDAVMAVFGVPVARTTQAEIAADAKAAVGCALAMRKELSRFNTHWGSRGLPPIGIRVGIYTGELVSGSLGSSDRMEYTVIGDTVNTASRLESFKLAPGEAPPEALAEEKDGACRIMVGDSTARLLGDAYVLAAVGEVRLKGKEQPVRVFSLVGER